MRKTARLAGVLAVSAIAPFASADVVQLDGQTLGSTGQAGARFSGSIEYLYESGETGGLFVTLRNDTAENLGGALTGFAFSIASDDEDRAAWLVESEGAGFQNTGRVIAAPFGFFDAGASVSGLWDGAGSLADGLAPGETGTFRFEVSASDAGSLSASSFAGGVTGDGFAVRFETPGRSEEYGCGCHGRTVVPSPASTALVALGGLFSTRRKRA